MNQRNVLVSRLLAQRDRRRVSFAPADRQPLTDVDSVTDKRPVAANLDRVAVAGAGNRLGQRVELALGDARAAEDDETRPVRCWRMISWARAERAGARGKPTRRRRRRRRTGRRGRSSCVRRPVPALRSSPVRLPLGSSTRWTVGSSCMPYSRRSPSGETPSAAWRRAQLQRLRFRVRGGVPEVDRVVRKGREVPPVRGELRPPCFGVCLPLAELLPLGRIPQTHQAVAADADAEICLLSGEKKPKHG